jgi:hypothetical protein
LILSTFLVAQGTPASAQATRTWVSGVGDDANPCSRTAPCKTFPGAISKTAAGGEINVLDPGGFGAVTITKPITIRSDHVEAGVLVSGTNGIIVSAGANDKVVLDGLDIDGVGSGLNGVHVLAGGVVQIVNCAIRRFAGNGVNVVSNTATRVTITNSVISFNAGGVHVQGNGAGNSANVNDTLLDGNSAFGLQTNNAGNAISVFRSTIIGSPAAVSVLNGSVIASRGTSNVMTGTTTGLTFISFN